MIVTITGLYIPNTNKWDIDESWTFGQLRADVVAIMTAKTAPAEEFDLFVGGELVDYEAHVAASVSDDGEVEIRKT